MKPGDLLLEFDIAAIEQAGYKAITPVIVTNSDDFAGIQGVSGAVEAGQGALLTLTR